MSESSIKRLCVFCGANTGNDRRYAEAAGTLGQQLAAKGIELVYGGTSVGLMGIAADAALAVGGKVIGVLPQSLQDREVAHGGLTKLHVVKTMHERKALMTELSDGFIALPGGIGTFEELFEVWTGAYLGHHSKPCSFLNVNGFYDGLIKFLDHVLASGFMKAETRKALIVSDDPAALIDKLSNGPGK
jgi:uncharacterized protein (TIGR00730 family)